MGLSPAWQYHDKKSSGCDIHTCTKYMNWYPEHRKKLGETLGVSGKAEAGTLTDYGPE